MSCNGCRILRKGCSHDKCILRQSLHGIEISPHPQAQANATLFLAKFYGRAALMSFLSSVPQSQRPALFQSLLYEACGRTVNPVTGGVGLLSSGNWHLCQAAVEKVFQGGVLALMEEFPSKTPTLPLEECDHSDASELQDVKQSDHHHQSINVMSRLRLPARMTGGGRVKRTAATPLESETTTLESCSEYNIRHGRQEEKPLLRRFL